MKDEVRVLQVTESLESGGRESFVMNLYRNIDKEKVKFDFFSLSNEEEFYTKEAISLGANIFSSKTFDQKPGIIRFLRKNLYLYRIMKKNKYSIVHIHACTPLDYIKVLFAKLAKVKLIIMHAHSSYYKLDSISKQLTIKFIKLVFSSIPNYCISCSIESADFLYTKKTIQSKKFKIIDNSVELEKYYYNHQYRNYYRKLLKIDKEFVIGHVGRFSKEKNHEFIIECFYKIVQRNKNVILMLVGDGELKDNIKSLAVKYNLIEKVIFLEPTKEVYKIYQAMDIFWFPSLFESFGMVALEAQISGLKVLISDNVPKKVSLTESAEILSLDKNIWCERTILALNEYKRQNYSESNIFENYNLKYTIQFFEMLYCGGIK